MTDYAIQDSLTSEEIKFIRKKLKMTQKELAALTGVSLKTVERWESSSAIVKGAAAVLLCILRDRPWLPEELEIPEKCFPLRLEYYFNNQLCTVIDVDDRNQRIKIKNYVTDPLFRAFGKNESPSYKEYEHFLESRCFPETRDKMKLILKDLNLPFYDPLMIIAKTGGRMAEDCFHIEIERQHL